MLSWNRLTHAAGILDNLIDRSESSTEPCATRDLDARQRISENATGTRGRLLMAAALPSARQFSMDSDQCRRTHSGRDFSMAGHQ
jgi:hypothetical protein